MLYAFLIALAIAVVLGIAYYFELKSSRKQADEQKQLLADYQLRVDEQQKLLEDYRALEKNFDNVGEGYEQALLAFDKMEEEKEKSRQANEALEKRCNAYGSAYNDIRCASADGDKRPDAGSSQRMVRCAHRFGSACLFLIRYCRVRRSEIYNRFPKGRCGRKDAQTDGLPWLPACDLRLPVFDHCYPLRCDMGGAGLVSFLDMGSERGMGTDNVDNLRIVSASAPSP